MTGAGRFGLVAMLLVACRPAPAAPAPAPTVAERPRAPAGPPDVSNEAAFVEWCRAFMAANARSLQVSTAERPLSLDGVMPGGDALQISLADPWQVCTQERHRCDAFTRMWLSDALRTIETPIEPPRREQIRAVIRRDDYVQELRRGTAPAPITEPFVPGLAVVYMVDLPQAAFTLRQEDLDQLGMNAEQLRQAALTNLERELGSPAELVHALPSQGIGYITEQNYYNSSLLLLHDAWKPVSEAYGGELLVSVPAPEVLLYADGRGKDARAALRAIAGEISTQAPNAIYAGVLRWTAAGWEIVD